MVDSVDVIVLQLGGTAINPELHRAVTHLRSLTRVTTIEVENGAGVETVESTPFGHRHRFASNRGYAGAVNAGVRSGSAPTIVILTADARPHRDALVQLVAAVEQLDVGVAGPELTVDDAQWFGGTWSTAYGWARHRLRLDDTDPVWLDGACLVFRRSVFDEVGGFDEGSFLYVEDVRFCRDVRSSGLRVVLVPDAKLEQDSGMYKRSGAHGYLVARNEIRTVHADPQGKTLLSAAVQLLRCGIELVRALITGQKQHHFKQAVGFLVGTAHGLAGRTGRPPKVLCRWANIPQ